MNAKRERLEQFQLFFRGRNTSLNFSRIHQTNSRAFSGCILKTFAGINGVAVSEMLEGPASWKSPSDVLYFPMGKVRRRLPVLQVDNRSESAVLKIVQNVPRTAFASLIRSALASGLTSGINFSTISSSSCIRLSGELLQTKLNFRYTAWLLSRQINPCDKSSFSGPGVGNCLKQPCAGVWGWG